MTGVQTCALPILVVGDEVTKEAENDAKMRMMIYLNMTSKAAI